MDGSAHRGINAEHTMTASSAWVFFRALTSFLVLALLLAACANPRPPTGGPPDQTPPALEASTPEAGAVNVSAASVQMTFSEYVDAASFARAFSINPPLEGRLVFKWRRRRVEIRFPEPLRENTTYILTLDTDLRDAHNVALKQPITLAFSTGPVINKGRIAGRVLDAGQGTGLSGFDVLAYAAPDSAAPAVLPERPDYRTQTDEGGQFAFAYLNEQPYFVVAVQDRNRNRRPDATEAFAVPPRPVLRADTVQTGAEDLRWLAAPLDTIPPALQRVRPLSSRRLALRFSESIQLTSRDTTGWLLQDSLAGRNVALRAVYLFPDDPRQVFWLTDSLAAVPHRLRVGATVTDSSGNRVLPDVLGFTPPAEADTLRLRFLGFAPQPTAPGGQGPSVLPPSVLPGVRFNQPLDEARLREIVAVQDTTGQALAFTAASADGTTYRLQQSPALQPGQTLQVRVDGRRLGAADTVFTQRFERISPRQLGDLSGTVTARDTSRVIVVELYVTGEQASARPYATTQADATGRFLFRDLPEHTYRFRAFVDHNGNGRWDVGTITPYRPAEPVAWATEAPSWRARWESALADTLRIPAP